MAGVDGGPGRPYVSKEMEPQMKADERGWWLDRQCLMTGPPTAAALHLRSSAVPLSCFLQATAAGRWRMPRWPPEVCVALMGDPM
jgi:hypothetical protein